MGFFNIDSANDNSNSINSTNVDRSKIKAFCTACKPGYK